MITKTTGIGNTCICIHLHQINCFQPEKFYYNEHVSYFNKDVSQLFKDKTYFKMTITSNQNDKRLYQVFNKSLSTHLPVKIISIDSF